MKHSVETDRHMAEAIVRTVTEQHGERFSAGDIEFLRGQLRRASTLLAEIDRVPLSNADGPDFGFPAPSEPSPESRS
jgi:hypothetical protein